MAGESSRSKMLFLFVFPPSPLYLCLFKQRIWLILQPVLPESIITIQVAGKVLNSVLDGFFVLPINILTSTQCPNSCVFFVSIAHYPLFRAHRSQFYGLCVPCGSMPVSLYQAESPLMEVFVEGLLGIDGFALILRNFLLKFAHSSSRITDSPSNLPYGTSIFESDLEAPVGVLCLPIVCPR